MLIINSKKELIDYLRTDRESDNKITLIPTMGNLHKGHLSLIDKSEEFLSKKVVSIFVNPLQFDDLDDYTSYPKTIEKDLEALEKKEIDVSSIPAKDFNRYSNVPYLKIYRYYDIVYTYLGFNLKHHFF